MLILFRHDDTAQVIIHTANMIDRDWTNMTQAVWASPPLPLLSQRSPPGSSIGFFEDTPSSQPNATGVHPIGSGERFKVDLLRYLDAYEKRLKPLITQLKDYDFSSVRAAFIGSAPSRQKPAAATPARATSFGWLGLQEILSCVPIAKSKDDASPPHIITQISSIATLGPNPTWLSHFQSVLARYAVSGKPLPSFSQASTFFAKRAPAVAQKKLPAPKYSVVFPTPEIRTSLGGYDSGHSIHWKLQSAQQHKQLEYMHPLLCHWKHPSTSSSSSLNRREAQRGSAAPHIKTYIRFSNEEHKTIDWAMVTSANLSKQAWGDVVNKKEETWIQSWETGVVVWPSLFSPHHLRRHPGPIFATLSELAQAVKNVIMVPVFGNDMPGSDDLPTEMAGTVASGEGKEKDMPNAVVGFRMPYDLQLVPYTADERPWCATMQYSEPDRHGRAWAGYGR
jgi:tyrosyl-DNA phosphodiesterase-1